MTGSDGIDGGRHDMRNHPRGLGHGAVDVDVLSDMPKDKLDVERLLNGGDGPLEEKRNSIDQLAVYPNWHDDRTETQITWA